MRFRATVAAVTGALALSAFAVPAAHAGGNGSVDPSDAKAAVQGVQRAASGQRAYTDTDDGTPYPLEASFSGVKINNGKPIVAGIGGHVVVPVTYQVTHTADVDLNAQDVWMDVEIYRGDYNSENASFLIGDDWPTCTNVSTTVANCKGTIDIRPGADYDDLSNADATTWNADGYIIDWNGQDPWTDEIDYSKVGYFDQVGLGTTKLQRQSRLSVDATPEPVKKGKTITVTGKLTRANWDTSKYTGYASQPVKLQFRKKGTSTYTTVKTIKTSSTGALKTTVKASKDGYYRYSFAGNATTPAVNATGDFIDVK